MLPRDGGITSAPDATEALIRAVSRSWAIQAAQFAEAQYTKAQEEEVLSVEDFRKYALDGNLLAADQIESWIHAQDERDGAPSWWFGGIALNEEDYVRLGNGM